MDRALLNLRRRLERWELLHLREHCSELAERLEEAERRAHDAESRADWLHDNLREMHEAIDSDDGASHRSVGLTKDGALLVVRLDHEPPPAHS